MMSKISTLRDLLMFESLPKGVPTFSGALTDKDLKTLYDFFNKTHFNNTLPNAKLKFLSSIKSFFGKTHGEFDNDQRLKSILITMASFAKTNHDKVSNTLLHEMIHVWQYTKFSQTGSPMYLDLPGRGAGKFTNRGHGEFFHKWASKFNSMGYTITVEDGLPSDTKLMSGVYVIAFDLGNDASVILQSKANPEKFMDKIILQVEKRIGFGAYKSYTIFTTKDSSVIQSIKLSKSFELPKGAKNIQFKATYMDRLMKADSSKGHKTTKNTILTASKVPNSIVRMVAQIHKYRSISFSLYFHTAIYNSEGFKHLMSIPGFRLSNEPDPEHKITAEIIEFVKQDWLEITDIEVKRSKAFKYFLSNLEHAILLNQNPDSGLQELVKNYEEDYRERVDPQRFKKLLYSFLINALNKKAKKSPKYSEYASKEWLSDQVFKGSIFEGMTLHINELLDLMEGLQ